MKREVYAEFSGWWIRLSEEWITLVRSWEHIWIAFKSLTNCEKMWHHTYAHYSPRKAHCVRFSVTTSNYRIVLFICSQLKGEDAVEERACEYMMSTWQRNPHWNIGDKSDGRWAQNCQTRATAPTWSVYYSAHHADDLSNQSVFARETTEVNPILKVCFCVSEDEWLKRLENAILIAVCFSVVTVNNMRQFWFIKALIICVLLSVNLVAIVNFVLSYKQAKRLANHLIWSLKMALKHTIIPFP